jgi:hypothetical protein
MERWWQTPVKSKFIKFIGPERWAVRRHSCGFVRNGGFNTRWQFIQAKAERKSLTVDLTDLKPIAIKL